MSELESLKEEEKALAKQLADMQLKMKNLEEKRTAAEVATTAGEAAATAEEEGTEQQQPQLNDEKDGGEADHEGDVDAKGKFCN
jgi:DNA-binding protein YbaB